MEPTETLEPRHAHVFDKLLQTNRAFRAVDAVFFRGVVREHARPAWPARALTRRRTPVRTVRGDARVDVCLPLSLVIRQVARRELPMANGTFVLLGELRRVGWQWSPMCCVG